MVWSKIRLGDVLSERREVPDAEALALGTIRIISKIGFNEGKIEFRSDTATKTGMILVRPGDLVVSGINAAKGAIAIYNEENSEPVAATIHYGAYEVRKDRADTNFLWWYLRSAAFRGILLEALPGGIKTELKASRLLPIVIPLPPLAEQQRIVAHIESLATKIAEAHSIHQQAVIETQACYAKALLSVFDELVAEHRPIGECFKVTTGGTPSRSNPAYWNGNVRWISSGEVAFSRITDTSEKITQLGVESSNAKVYPPGTVLLAMIGQGKTRGQCAILGCHAATNQNVAGIHVYQTNHLPEYVYWWLFANYQKSRSTETGTAQPALSGERVKQMTIPLPEPSKQRRIVTHLDNLQAKVSALNHVQSETVAELDAMLPAILDRAFKGEL